MHKLKNCWKQHVKVSFQPGPPLPVVFHSSESWSTAESSFWKMFSFVSSLPVRSLLLHFCFANKSVGAIIRARIKTIRASEERERLHDAIRACQETSPGGQGGHGPSSANQSPVLGSRDLSGPIRGQYWWPAGGKVPGHLQYPEHRNHIVTIDSSKTNILWDSQH